MNRRLKMADLSKCQRISSHVMRYTAKTPSAPPGAVAALGCLAITLALLYPKSHATCTSANVSKHRLKALHRSHVMTLPI